mmetsp:Transcript_23030/g.67960  ORF Transcript_23030/g.67960 Transcript_23030/m.67960 type:complete len:449 (-) Transcript_23030:82-1428(-)
MQETLPQGAHGGVAKESTRTGDDVHAAEGVVDSLEADMIDLELEPLHHPQHKVPGMVEPLVVTVALHGAVHDSLKAGHGVQTRLGLHPINEMDRRSPGEDGAAVRSERVLGIDDGGMRTEPPHLRVGLAMIGPLHDERVAADGTFHGGDAGHGRLLVEWIDDDRLCVRKFDERISLGRAGIDLHPEQCGEVLSHAAAHAVSAVHDDDHLDAKAGGETLAVEGADGPFEIGTVLVVARHDAADGLVLVPAPDRLSVEGGFLRLPIEAGKVGLLEVVLGDDGREAGDAPLGGGARDRHAVGAALDGFLFGRRRRIVRREQRIDLVLEGHAVIHDLLVLREDGRVLLEDLLILRHELLFDKGEVILETIDRRRAIDGDRFGQGIVATADVPGGGSGGSIRIPGRVGRTPHRRCLVRDGVRSSVGGRRRRRRRRRRLSEGLGELLNAAHDYI